METTKNTHLRTTPCGASLPDLEIPMVNAMVSCLTNEHRKLDEQVLELALAATRLASEPDSLTASQRAVELWDAIRSDLWSHLQIEEELVFAWAGGHQAISPELLNTLKIEREELSKVLAGLPGLLPGEDGEAESTTDSSGFARTLKALAQNLDSHVERYDTKVLPSILRAVVSHGTAREGTKARAGDRI
jgi:iron-sulfur cluster repair protein YtfE (RIC family)